MPAASRWPGFARGMVIEERFDPSLPPVLIDPDAFQQVMLNLVKNAAEALAGLAQPRITLATAYRHGMSVSAGPAARASRCRSRSA
jgi:two-component system nitrogen regulation sensor histidine kinase GlnL